MGMATIALMVYTIFAPFPSEMAPKNWSNTQNALYYAISRFTWAFCWMVIFFMLVMDYAPLLKCMCSNSYANVAGTLVWPSYIFAPLIYMNCYSTMEESFYMTMLGNVILGIGSMNVTLIFSVIFIVFIQSPIDFTVEMSMRRFL